MDLAEFFAMGGYGGYVWGSYGIAALVLILNIVLPLRGRRAVLRRAQAAQRERPARAQVKRGNPKKSVRKKSP